MKRFCVIGMGNFGYHVARTLYEEGHEVVAVDMHSEKVQRVHDHVSYALVGDAASKDFLQEQGIDQMDAVVVSTSDRSHLSTLITLFLKELGTPRILVKAVSEDHGRILKKVGATEVIFPEKDMALKTARTLSSPNILEFIPLAEDYSIIETAPPQSFLGKNMIDLDLRRRHRITVIGIKDGLTDTFEILPSPTRVIRGSDLLILIGKSEDVEKACQS